MERITVSVSKTYDILIEGGLISRVGRHIKEIKKGGKVAIIADEKTSSLFGETVKSSLQKEGFVVYEFTVLQGEESKCAENYIWLLNSLAKENFSRSDLIVALGGGVVGDLSGFVAATFLRGISYVQIPTTLLAAVDSSVGGKTAINLDAGKNLAGAFCQPSLVLCDSAVISDLPDEVFAAGMSEVIKYGAIRNAGIFELINSGARENIEKIIYECVKIKRDIVANDEFDTGERQLLNFGHTPAHAIEKKSSFEISHGRAVAVGMCIMARASEKCGYCEENISEELEKLCEKFSLPTECDFTADELFEIAMTDKKRSEGKITLVFPKRRGECKLVRVSEDDAKCFFEMGLERR